MKLALCIECKDVRKLRQTRTYCACRKAWAKYKDDREHKVIANHYALIIGIDSDALKSALERKVDRMSSTQKLDVFLLPEPCTTVARVGRLAA